MVSGFWPTLLVGVVGGFLGELLRIIPTLGRRRRRPRIAEVLVSVAYVAIGAGAVLFGWSDPQRAISVAVLGAAFPSVFSNLVRATTPPQPTRRGPGSNRSLVDYAAGRFGAG